MIALLKNDTDREDFIASAERAGCAIEELKNIPKLLIVTGTLPENLAQLCDKIEDESETSIENQQVEIADDFSGGNWGLPRVIRRRSPWPTSRLQFPQSVPFSCVRDGTGVDVYVIDSGVMPGHNEVSGRVTSIYEEMSSGGLGDDNGHGTQCASLAAGSTLGTARGAQILSCKVQNSGGSGTASGFIRGVNEILESYSSRDRPAVCNMSMGGLSSTANSAVSSLIDAGVVVCASAGNSGSDLGETSHYPAESDPAVIVVGGMGPADLPYYRLPTSLSSYGERLDVLAAGQMIYGATIPDADSYWRVSGTSSSCAIVTGVVACVLQGYAKLTSRDQVEAVREHIRNTATTGQLKGAEWTTYPGTLPDRIAYLDPLVESPETLQ